MNSLTSAFDQTEKNTNIQFSPPHYSPAASSCVSAGCAPGHGDKELRVSCGSLLHRRFVRTDRAHNTPICIYCICLCEWHSKGRKTF